MLGKLIYLANTVTTVHAGIRNVHDKSVANLHKVV